ncbi:MAG: hypothetical protein WCJ51_01785 [Candidatus Moraniibacteriota bacterium]
MNLIEIAHADIITDAPSFSTIGMKILDFLLSAFGVVAIIMLVVSGIVYFFSADDKKRMEKAKKSATFAIVGIVLAMSGMIIVKTIGQFLK